MEKISDAQHGINKISAVETLIANKMMLVHPEKYHVAMLAELWNLYSDEKKHDLCQNILFYCKVKNNLSGGLNNGNPVLLVSIKDSQNNVSPFAYYKNEKIELIKK